MSYNPRAYEPTAVTVDIVALTIRADGLNVLLVERGEEPFLGRLALPGGFVRSSRDAAGRLRGETLDQAAARELAEETGLRPGHARLRRVHLEQLATYSAVDRDPRMRVFSVAYLALAADLPDPVAGGDAAAAAWVPVDSVHGRSASSRASAHGRSASSRAEAGRLAFDHATILADGLERARAKLEYTPLATSFVGPEFTMSELRAVYAAVWGVDPHAGNFHRKVLSVPGFVVDLDTVTSRGGERGGRRSRLYRAGDATLLHPAILRP